MAGLASTDDKPRPFPFLGTTAMISGAGLVFVLKRFPVFADYWDGKSYWILFAAAVYLLLWGLRQLLASVKPEWRVDRFSRWNRHRMAVTREGLAYIGIMSVMFIGSILGRTNMLMFVFAMMIGPWVLNGWIAFSMLRRTSAKRTLPRRAMAGEMVSVEIEVVNQKWLLSSWLLAARDRVVHARDQFQAAALFVRIPARQSRRGHYFVRFSQRGEYSFGPVELTTHFPLGLIERGLVCPEAGRLIVHPQVGRMTARWRSDLWNATELAEQRQMRAGLFDDEFQRIREYRTGDNPKAIHWRTTARRGELMVREFQQTRDRDLILLVELWQPALPAAADLDRVELAVSFAASVLYENLRQSREARLRIIIIGAKTVVWDHQSSMELALDHLALAASSPEANIRRTLEETMRGISSSSRVVVISSRQRGDLEMRTHGVVAPVEFLCLSANPRDLSPYFVLEGMA